jgi:hypothetical protein
MNHPTPELVQAFSDTHYTVHSDPPFTLRIGLPFVDGIGQHPSNGWPGEASVLVLGLDRQAAMALAKAHEQHAFVWVGGDGVAELVWPEH